MLPGPMFFLEMVTSARRTRYFVIRALYAVVLLLCLLMIYNDSAFSNREADIATLARFSYSFFVAFSILQLLLVVGLGPAMSAGTIATERERKTIEHLFVTQLSNAEIVLGKLFARLVQIAYLTLVGLPILALAMLMGGIAPEALAMLYLITISTMLTVSILSITVSVWSARAREAVVRAYLLVFVWLVIPPILYLCNRSVLSSTLLDSINGELLATNPFWVFSNILTWASGVQVRAAWGLLGEMARNQGIVCLAGIIASTLAVRRVHLKNRGAGEKKRRLRLQWLRPGVSDRPMIWKELFAEPAASKLGKLGYVLMGIIVLAVLGFTEYYYWESFQRASWRSYANRHQDFLQFTTFMSTTLCCGALLIMAARAAGAITSEKERDCWISLLSTPLTPREIVWSKVAGNLYAARWIFFLLAVIWGAAVSLEPGFIAAIFFQLGTLLVLAFFVSSLGVLYSLWCKTSLKAMAATLATLVFVGGGYLFCCMVVLIGGGGGDGVQIIIAGLIPFLLAFPDIAYVESGVFHREAVLPAAYALGTGGYALAGFVLFASAVGNFDSFAGRVGGNFQSPWPRPLPPSVPPRENPPDAIVAEAVEE
ncbi:MAG: ABC transporter permease subunit [Pirellulales bacterium]|nr:ABC transporter permease subunit [Pirellulales bacterium]